MSRPAWRVLIPLTLSCTIVLLSPATVAQDETAAALGLSMAPEMDVRNATLLLGALGIEGDARLHPAFVGVRHMTLPPGTLSVCPAEGTNETVALVRSLLADEAPCDEAEVHEDPQLAFGPRSWLQVASTYDSTDGGRAGTHMVSTRVGETITYLASVVATGTVSYAADDALMRFQPILPATEVRVIAEDGNASYNGTEWRFFFDFADHRTFSVVTEGVLEQLDQPVGMRLEPMAPRLVDLAFEPRVLLDMQEVVVGPDRRASVANVTAHLDLSRAPPLVNGAIVGRLNGTVDGRNLSAEPVAHARYQGIDLRYDDTVLRGFARADFVLTEAGVTRGGDAVGSPPWALGIVLWIGALLAVLLGRAWAPHGWWSHAVETAIPLLAFVVWDQRLEDYLGTSGLGLLFGGDYGLSSAFRLLLFEALGLALVYLVVYLPLRTIGRRTAPPRWHWAATAAAALAFLGYLWIFDQHVVAGTLVFARL